MQPPKRVLHPLLLLLSLLTTGASAQAQTNPVNAIEANIIYHFTKYIDWSNKDEPGDFVIGVIGNTPTYDEMVRLMTQRTVGSKKITIKKIQPGPAAASCQILFIPEVARGCLREVSTETASSATLIVCEGSGLARKGAAIDLVLSDDHLKLEINKANIEHHKLQIASELLQLGTAVN
jgi:hypothetical protein